MAKNLTILLFAPHAAIWVHAFPEALVAESLQERGHRIIYVTCGREFQDYCVCMSARGLFQTSSQLSKQDVCNICNHQKNIIKKNFKFNGYDINEFITKSEREQIELILKETTYQNFLNLKLDGISIGRTALYEFLLQYKKIDLHFSESEWSSYLIALKNTLISFFASRRILEQESPDRVLTYNSLYSVNRICCQLAESRGIPTFFLHAGHNLSNRLETMLLGAKTTFDFNQNLKKYWDIYKNVACMAENIRLVTNHFIELFQGNHFLAYSSAKNDKVNIRDFFEIRKTQKILVATMSSYDERFAAETINVIPQFNDLIFPKQIDWINFLIGFVKDRPDLFLIIRIHPREFPNKRDSVRSQHSLMLEVLLTNLPENVKINSPKDNLSIYDLAEYTDLFLNAWSSVGEEMSLFGIPVLIYSDDLVSYPSDINYCAINKEDFCNKIDIALTDGWSFERIRNTYRWYALKFVYSTFDISDNVNWYREKTPEPKLKKFMFELVLRAYHKISSAILKIDTNISYHQQIQDCKQRMNQLQNSDLINNLIEDNREIVLDLIDPKSMDSINIDLETSLIKYELSRLFKLSYPENISKQNEDNQDNISPLIKKLLTSLKS